MRKILIHAHLAVESAKWTDPHTKANALLQAHFGRAHISVDLQSDQSRVLPLATRLLQVRSWAALWAAELHARRLPSSSQSTACRRAWMFSAAAGG